MNGSVVEGLNAVFDAAGMLTVGLHVVNGVVQVVEGPNVSTRGTHHGSRLDLDTLRTIDRRKLAMVRRLCYTIVRRLNYVSCGIRYFGSQVCSSSRLLAMVRHGIQVTPLAGCHQTQKAVDVRGGADTCWPHRLIPC